MSNQKKRRLSILFIAVLMAFLGYRSMKLGQSLRVVENTQGVPQVDKYFIIVGVLLMTIVVLAVHELGHLLAGISQGFRFELFVVRGRRGIRNGSIRKRRP